MFVSAKDSLSKAMRSDGHGALVGKPTTSKKSKKSKNSDLVLVPTPEGIPVFRPKKQAARLKKKRDAKKKFDENFRKKMNEIRLISNERDDTSNKLKWLEGMEKRGEAKNILENTPPPTEEGEGFKPHTLDSTQKFIAKRQKKMQKEIPFVAAGEAQQEKREIAQTPTPQKKSLFISAKDSLNKGVLSTKQRENLKQKQFALPKKAEDKEEKGESGNYPIPDLSHARSALALVAIHGTPAEQAKVRAAVYKKYPQLDKRKEEEHKKSMGYGHGMKKAGETQEEEYVGHDERYEYEEGEKAGRKEEKKKLDKSFFISASDRLSKAKPKVVGMTGQGGQTVAVPVGGSTGPKQTKVRQPKVTALKGQTMVANKEGKVTHTTHHGAGDDGEDVTDIHQGVTIEAPNEESPAVATKPVPKMKKSIDPALAARMNMEPLSMAGAMATPGVGHKGFSNPKIGSAFSKSGDLTFEEKKAPVLRRPNR